MKKILKFNIVLFFTCLTSAHGLTSFPSTHTNNPISSYVAAFTIPFAVNLITSNKINNKINIVTGALLFSPGIISSIGTLINKFVYGISMDSMDKELLKSTITDILFERGGLFIAGIKLGQKSRDYIKKEIDKIID